MNEDNQYMNREARRRYFFRMLKRKFKEKLGLNWQIWNGGIVKRKPYVKTD